MSADAWTLQFESEFRVLLPWLVSEKDPQRRKALTAWLLNLQRDPFRGKQEVPGVFSYGLQAAGLVVVWTLDHESREIILALIGES
jgi:hypothetical protein